MSPEKFVMQQVKQIDNPDYIANKEGTKEVKIAAPLNYLCNFWRALKMPLIHCEVSLTLT